VAIKFFTLSANVHYNAPLNGMNTCYKLFTRGPWMVFVFLVIKRNRLNFVPETTAEGYPQL
jgi:hypothetical protein